MAHLVPAENGLDHLLQWYREQCDGDWEHEFGIRIETLDNPGWDLEVDLAGTFLEGRVMEGCRKEVAGGRWIFVASTGLVFKASCDPLSLEAVLVEFRRFVESQ